ncbi:hypothetical protein K525DRAFT_211238 [Schizophyllum commune Loenen D]|nr:hypothetical protein K525DRAFT_211238 [Schizophyllum commune Loenen D]
MSVRDYPTSSAPNAHRLPLIYQPDPYLGLEWATSSFLSQPLLVLPDRNDENNGDDQVTRLDDYIASLYTHITSITRHRNMLLQISHLPSEILSSIFLLVASSREGQPRHPKYWTGLMLVCRRWRIVGVSSPILWSHMSIMPSGEARLALPPPHQSRYCGAHPLTVAIYLTDNFRSAWPRLQFHADYIRELTMHGSGTCLNTFFGLFGESRRDSLRNLSVTHIVSPTWTDSGPCVIPPEASRNIASNLQKLHLDGTALDWDVLHSLTSLDVKCLPRIGSTAPWPVTASCLLAVVRRSPSLQHLSLETYFATDGLSTHGKPVELPYLRSLDLRARPLVCAFIMSALRMPAHVRLSVHSNNKNETEDNYRRLCEALRGHFSHSSTLILRTLQLREQHQWAWYVDLPAEDDCSRAIPGEHVLLLHLLSPFDDDDLYERTLRQALDAVPSGQVEYLHSCQGKAVLKAGARRLLLPLLPSLRLLCFNTTTNDSEWFDVVQEWVAQGAAPNGHLRRIHWSDRSFGRRGTDPKGYVSVIALKLRMLLDTYVVHRPLPERLVLRERWLGCGAKEMADLVQYALDVGVRVDINPNAKLGAILFGASRG